MLGLFRTVFDLSSKERRESELLDKTAQPGFWEQDEAQHISRELAHLQELKEEWRRVSENLANLEALAELLAEESDLELTSEFYEAAAAFEKEIEERQTRLLLDGEFDENNAILSVHAGAGGLDSQDWAEMMLRMYLRWSERRRFQAQVLDIQDDGEAGIKSATVMVKGPYAFGYLRAEVGVHRLVRISPFDAAKRRHTSFGSVQVAPELPDDAAIVIRPEDLKLDTFRASGAGGQYVNMTDSAIRITHIPTGIIVACQDQRSQHANRQVAMTVLRAKLFERQQRERQEQLESLQGEKKEIGWSSQIRSYVLHPYLMIKDHRTGYEVGNVQAVLDGDLDPFIFAYLRWSKSL